MDSNPPDVGLTLVNHGGPAPANPKVPLWRHRSLATFRQIYATSASTVRAPCILRRRVDLWSAEDLGYNLAAKSGCRRSTV